MSYWGWYGYYKLFSGGSLLADGKSSGLKRGTMVPGSRFP